LRKLDTTNEMREMLMCLQVRGITLADAQLHLDYLTGQFNEGNMEGCRLGITYIGKDRDKLVTNDFHNVVAKVQTAVILMLLTPREEAAVHCLRKDSCWNSELPVLRSTWETPFVSSANVSILPRRLTASM
jgi:hypothetical protein